MTKSQKSIGQRPIETAFRLALPHATVNKKREKAEHPESEEIATVPIVFSALYACGKWEIMANRKVKS